VPLSTAIRKNRRRFVRQVPTVPRAEDRIAEAVLATDAGESTPLRVLVTTMISLVDGGCALRANLEDAPSGGSAALLAGG
jgi:hypothetical protein